MKFSSWVTLQILYYTRCNKILLILQLHSVIRQFSSLLNMGSNCCNQLAVLFWSEYKFLHVSVSSTCCWIGISCQKVKNNHGLIDSWILLQHVPGKVGGLIWAAKNITKVTEILFKNLQHILGKVGGLASAAKQ